MNERLAILLRKYFDQSGSEQETAQLMSLLKQSENDEQVKQLMEKEWSKFQEAHPYFNDEEVKGMLGNILGNARTKNIRIVHFLRKWGWAAAAAVILLLGIGAYLRTDNKKTMVSAEIQPGKEGAILTLADGTQIVLDSLGNGVIASQHGAQAVLKDGELIYDRTGSVSGEAVYNTMTTPKGRQFQVTLPDGTKVWLNSASSIRYPIVFAGSERMVTVTGEAYFEVAKNAKMPFKVNVNNKAEVEVLGTNFNVNAYDKEESINTTLLEGSVRVAAIVSSAQPAAILKPGQQAQIPVGQKNQPEKIKVINGTDIGKVMAWKNGLFNFEGATLEEVMRQLERWYNIEVVYEKSIPDIRFEGEMARDIPLSDLLIVLERSDVHFRMEGRKLIVLP